MEVELPFILHDYYFSEEIGRGGFSRVYLVSSEQYNQKFVAKVVQLSETNKKKINQNLNNCENNGCANITQQRSTSSMGQKGTAINSDDNLIIFNSDDKIENDIKSNNNANNNNNDIININYNNNNNVSNNAEDDNNNINNNNNVALKSIDQIFRTEIETLADLNHPNIIRFYDCFVENEMFVMILEYCPNGNLATEVKNSKGLPWDQFVNYGRQIVSALQYCHSRNIAHHDIKMQNILIDAYGRPKLADFGLSLKIDDNGSIEGSFKGSLLYTAPEIYLKKAYSPFKADIWALGVMFAFMINGESPWSGAKGVDSLKGLICIGNYSLSKKTPPILTDLIKKMIVVDPKKRISIQDLLDHPIFRVEAPTLNILSPRSLDCKMVDALSPRGRRQTVASASDSASALISNVSGNPPKKPKSIEIYKMNLNQGFSNSKKIKSRLCMMPKTFFC